MEEPYLWDALCGLLSPQGDVGIIYYNIERYNEAVHELEESLKTKGQVFLKQVTQVQLRGYQRRQTPTYPENNSSLRRYNYQ